jgi:uncharacterized cupredoxin-like copper-binding protein
MHHGSPSAGFLFGEPGKLGEVNRTLDITMGDMSFDPTSLEVAAGETIRFVVTNKSELDHDFTLGDIATQTAHRAEMAKASGGGGMEHGDDANAVMVRARQTRELIWKFTRPGTLEFDCNIPGHYEAGMKGVIAIRAK